MIYVKGRAKDNGSVWLAQDLTFGVPSTTDVTLSACLPQENCAASLGLDYGPASNRSDNTPQLFETLFQSGAIKMREIGIYYPPSSAGPDAIGQLSLGAVDSTKHSSKVHIVATPVIHTGNWSFTIDDVAHGNGTHFNLAANHRSAVGMNTLSFMAADLYAAMRFHAAIPGAKIYLVNEDPLAGETGITMDLASYTDGAGVGKYSLTISKP
jgi:Eukaryotic aspartyl protease